MFNVGDVVNILCDFVPSTELEVACKTGVILSVTNSELAFGNGETHYRVGYSDGSETWWFSPSDLARSAIMFDPEFDLDEIHVAQELMK